MKLVMIDVGRHGSAGALLRTGEVLNFSRAAAEGTLEAWIPGTVREVIEGGRDALGVVRALIARVEGGSENLLEQLRGAGAVLPARTPLLAPLPEPRLVVAAGLAYKSHLAEMSGTPTPKQPTAFMKSPNSITGPNHAVMIPPDASQHIDYEGELAVVFGKTCHRVDAQDALGYVAGYTAANDISARDWVRDVWESTQPWQSRQTWEVNIMGKQFGGFTPLGPVLLTADEVEDPGTLEITTRLNGVTMQQAPVSDLIFRLQETIAFLSRWYTFRAGDVLLSGTPAGVGVGRKPQVFMKDGDVIEVEISGIGVLRNSIQTAAA